MVDAGVFNIEENIVENVTSDEEVNNPHQTDSSNAVSISLGIIDSLLAATVQLAVHKSEVVNHGVSNDDDSDLSLGLADYDEVMPIDDDSDDEFEIIDELTGLKMSVFY